MRLTKTINIKKEAETEKKRGRKRGSISIKNSNNKAEDSKAEEEEDGGEENEKEEAAAAAA